MNAQQAENLRILIRHMETNVARKLDMGCVSDGCGTPACAFGEAVSMPYFRDMGLQFVSRRSTFMVKWRGAEKHICAPATEIFGVSGAGGFGESEYARLFGAWGIMGRSSNPSPQEWALEARKVLSENGYSMDDVPVAAKPDEACKAFVADLEKLAREPMPATEDAVHW